MSNYYQITFYNPEPKTIGIRAINMPSAMQFVVDRFQKEYIIEFSKIEKDNDVTEVYESDYDIQLESGL